MYAVKGGHVDIVKELLKHEFVDCKLENKVSLRVEAFGETAACKQ